MKRTSSVASTHLSEWFACPMWSFTRAERMWYHIEGSRCNAWRASRMIGSRPETSHWRRFSVSCQGFRDDCFACRPLRGRVRHEDSRAKILFENEEWNSRRRSPRQSLPPTQYITSSYILLEEWRYLLFVYRVLVRVVIAKLSVLHRDCTVVPIVVRHPGL